MTDGSINFHREVHAQRDVIGQQVVHGDVKNEIRLDPIDLPPPDPATLAAAEQLLASLPADDIPEPADLPQHSRMELRRNPDFVGRDDELRDLATALRGSRAVAIAATGTGGIGKTQLACEFAYRYGRYFAGGVYWLSFADGASVLSEVIRCGAIDGLSLQPAFDQAQPDTQASYVLGAWRSPLPRLLIFDNCEDEALLDQWRPAHGGCRILITSRNNEWSHGAHVTTLALHELAPADSVALLRVFLPAAPDADLRAIADELGHLPLALHLAGSFMADNTMRPAAYLKRIRTPNPLADRSLTRSTQTLPTRHDRDVARTFAVSYEQLDAEQDALALRLLHRAAHFAPGEPIPRWLLLLTVDVEDAAEDADDVSDEVLDAIAALRRLAALGLIERADAPDAHTVRLHRLVAAFVRGVATDDAARTATEDAMYRVANQYLHTRVPAPLLALQTHLRHITDAAQERTDELAARLCSVLDSHLDMIGDLAGARPYSERALAIREQVLGPQHPDTATSLNNLGLVLQAQGDYAGARGYFERALAITEQVLGPQHPDTATSLNNLGYLLRAQGDYAGARGYYERALAITEQVLGPQHPDTAGSLNNLAILCYYENDMEQAAALMRRALSILEQTLGPQHPHTQQGRQTLAVIEQRLAGDTPPSAAQQIATLEQQAQEAMAQALAQGTAAQRDDLAQQFEQVAVQAAEGEADGSPWLALAARLRAWAAELRAVEPSDVADIEARIMARIEQVRETGSAEERADLIARLEAAANAYEHHNRAAWLALAGRLRAWAAELRAEDGDAAG